MGPQGRTGIIDHVGVIVGPNTVLQNTPRKGEHLATIPDFSSAQPIKIARTGANPHEVVARAKKILANPQKYDVAVRNCEHTVSEVVLGFAKSPQIMFFCLLGVIVFFVLAVITRR
jgi:hypothetical protein